MELGLDGTAAPIALHCRCCQQARLPVPSWLEASLLERATNISPLNRNFRSGGAMRSPGCFRPASPSWPKCRDGGCYVKILVSSCRWTIASWRILASAAIRSKARIATESSMRATERRRCAASSRRAALLPCSLSFADTKRCGTAFPGRLRMKIGRSKASGNFRMMENLR